MSTLVDSVSFKALSDEVDATSSLFKHGLDILSRYRTSLDAEPVLVCVAGGCEKLLKLTFGLSEVEMRRPWPTPREMRSRWRHQIADLNVYVLGLIADRATFSTAPGHIRELLGRVADDDLILHVLGTVARYADQGRFYNLDALGGESQTELSPVDLWEELHQVLIAEHSNELAGFATRVHEDWEHERRSLNAEIVASVQLWCELIADHG